MNHHSRISTIIHEQKITADRGLLVLVELALREADDQAGFPHGGIAQQHELEVARASPGLRHPCWHDTRDKLLLCKFSDRGPTTVPFRPRAFSGRLFSVRARDGWGRPRRAHRRRRGPPRNYARFQTAV